MIKVVSFDIGGTLIKFADKRSLRQTLLRYFRVEPAVFHAAYSEHFTKNKGTLQEFCKQMRCESPREVEEVIARYYDEKPRGSLYGDVSEAFQHLKGAGVLVITLSNKSYRNPSRLADYGLDACLDAEIYSHQVGSMKPEREIFQYARELFRVQPGEIVHVGDSPGADIAGGNAAGCHTVLVRRGVEKPSRTPVEPEYTVDGLERLPAIVADLSAGVRP